MRQATLDTAILEQEEGEPTGFALGHGYCAEHEHGIAGLDRVLTPKDKGTRGLDAFATKAMPEDSPHIGTYRRKKATKTLPAEFRLVVTISRWNLEQFLDPKAKAYGLPARYNDEEFTTSWDDGGFCIRAFSPRAIQLAEDLYAAMISGDMLMSMSSQANPFGRSCLCLSIRSRIPQEVEDNLIVAQDEAARLAQAVNDTGIHKMLEAAERGFYALKPAWLRSNRTSEHPVEFFLNPRDQHLYNFGWFTVEDLQAWCRGEGPAMKEKKG